MTDILTELFGPDPNPDGPLPTLPYQGRPHVGCEHVWSVGVRRDVAYRECCLCYVVISDLLETS